MISKIRMKLTIFNIGVIGTILILIALAIFFRSPQLHSVSTEKVGVQILFMIRSGFVIMVSLILVFMGSYFIAGKALVPIKEAWQKQLDFTADASHELRTPLAVIQANLEVVLDNPEETVESQKKWLENILVENKRMSKLVDDLLTLSRTDANQQIITQSCFVLYEALEEAIIPFIPLASSLGISLNTCFDPHIEFYGDPDRLKQLLIILVDNALKYTSCGGKVDVAVKKKDKFVELTVSDTGEGIEKEYLKRIFDRFYRVDKARSRSKDGSGLGLAIAKWIIDEHHGSVHVVSAVGKGTKFVILLPSCRI